MITMLAQPLQTLRRYLLDRMVLRPSRDFIDHGSQRRVSLTVLNRPLECFVARNFDDNARADLVVLKFPGTAGRAERSSTFPLMMLEGVRGEVWTWNPPGYGGSHGRASLQGIADAALAFSQTILQRDHVRPNAVWLAGNSLGCNAALHVASRIGGIDVPVGLVLRNPPPLAPVVKRIANRYPLGRFVGPIADSVCHEMNALKTAPAVNFPAVFLQSQLDDLVPPSIQNELIDRYSGSSRLVEMAGLDHDGIPSEQQSSMIRSELRWLWQQMQMEPVS